MIGILPRLKENRRLCRFFRNFIWKRPRLIILNNFPNLEEEKL